MSDSVDFIGGSINDLLVDVKKPGCEVVSNNPILSLRYGVDRELLCMSGINCFFKGMYDEHLVCLFSVYNKLFKEYDRGVKK